MPLVRTQAEYEGPKGPHFALLTAEGWIGIPEGATLWLVEDGRNPTKIFPLRLSRVRHNRISFVMPDSQGNMTEYSYKLQNAKPLNKAALERLVKGRQTAPTVPTAGTVDQADE